MAQDDDKTVAVGSDATLADATQDVAIQASPQMKDADAQTGTPAPLPSGAQMETATPGPLSVVPMPTSGVAPKGGAFPDASFVSPPPLTGLHSSETTGQAGGVPLSASSGYYASIPPTIGMTQVQNGDAAGFSTFSQDALSEFWPNSAAFESIDQNVPYPPVISNYVQPFASAQQTGAQDTLVEELGGGQGELQDSSNHAVFALQPTYQTRFPEEGSTEKPTISFQKDYSDVQRGGANGSSYVLPPELSDSFAEEAGAASVGSVRGVIVDINRENRTLTLDVDGQKTTIEDVTPVTLDMCEKQLEGAKNSGQKAYLVVEMGDSGERSFIGGLTPQTLGTYYAQRAAQTISPQSPSPAVARG